MNYLPIENYGIVGDLNTIALIGMNGSIDFMCFPAIDSPSVFLSLLDSNIGGNFQIHPVQKEVNYKQMYLPDTNILITRFLSHEGIGEITDFMPVKDKTNEGSKIIRRLKTVRGKETYQLVCNPAFNYARSSHTCKVLNDKEILFNCEDLNSVKIKLRSNIPLIVKDNKVTAEFQLKTGESADFIFEIVNNEAEAEGIIESLVTDLLLETTNYWKKWIANSNYKGRWNEVVNRSTLVLKLLTSNKYGSVVAAPTFSLPENIKGKRNWDYRYVWIRDASFTIDSLIKLGYKNEATAFIKWIEHETSELEKAGYLSLLYTIDGKNKIEEQELTHLEGYKKSAPVRIGNEAYKQYQLDIYGELMQAVYLYDRHVEYISYDLWKNLFRQMEWLAEHWSEKDNGIWEIRTEQKDFLFSKLMCWVAFDCGIKIAESHSFPLPERWKKIRDTIYETIYADYWNEEIKSFVDIKGSDTVDASILLMPLVGFIGPKDTRWISTLRYIEKQLVSDCLVYRYCHEKFEDGLKWGEGTFSMCSFWYVECLSKAGELELARNVFEKMLGYANHLGLYAEQVGQMGEHLGNFPQGFTHYGLISAAFDLNDQLNRS